MNWRHKNTSCLEFTFLSSRAEDRTNSLPKFPPTPHEWRVKSWLHSAFGLTEKVSLPGRIIKMVKNPASPEEQVVQSPDAAKEQPVFNEQTNYVPRRTIITVRDPPSVFSLFLFQNIFCVWISCRPWLIMGTPRSSWHAPALISLPSWIKRPWLQVCLL